MTKKDLITAAAAKGGITQREIKQAIEPVFECILEALEKGENVIIQEFGTFYVKEWNERKSRIPYTGETIITPPRKVVKFKITRRSSLNDKGAYRLI
ncbi:DNA-binding protein HU [termite gut metagenome]|uniref:DNA-binding protein HU n=1 Tax=termite gut metagenome TaxID=433724 RepID=A0A5J4SSJ1_9ZZZZ